MTRQLCEICELKMVDVYGAGRTNTRLGRSGDVEIVACEDCRAIAQKATGYREPDYGWGGY